AQPAVWFVGDGGDQHSGRGGRRGGGGSPGNRQQRRFSNRRAARGIGIPQPRHGGIGADPGQRQWARRDDYLRRRVGGVRFGDQSRDARRIHIDEREPGRFHRRRRRRRMVCFHQRGGVELRDGGEHCGLWRRGRFWYAE